LIVVSEYYGTPINEKHSSLITFDVVLSVLYQTACGLDFLLQNCMVHHNLEPNNILLDNQNNVKLFNYALFHMTNAGKYTSFPVGNIKYLPPERILGHHENIKSDVWSLAIIIIELLLECTLWSSLKISQVISHVSPRATICN
jgi:TBC domain-containing protein kinase-like protein